MQYIDKDGNRHNIPLYSVQPLVSPDPDNKLYKSPNGLKVDNTGGGDGIPIGFIGYFGSNAVPEGYLICNGQAVSRTTYKELFDVIGTTFGTGDGSSTFNIPNLIDKFAQGSATVGTNKEAGLPNIQGNIAMNYISNDGYSALHTQRDGAFSRVDSSYGSGGRRWPLAGSTGDSRAYPTLRFNAANSNAIYGKSTTVQPPALTLLPCIKALNTGKGGGGGTGSFVELTQAEYDALPESEKQDENIAYFVDNPSEGSEQLVAQELAKAIFDSIYPVGSYAFGVKPAIGTWVEIEGDRALWLKNTADDGTEIEQALPNVTGAIRFNSQGGIIHSDASSYSKGALRTGDTLGYTFVTSGTTSPWIKNDNGRELAIDANKSNSIYKDGANVQPNAYVMKVFKRTA